MGPLRGAIVGFGFIAEKGHLPAYLEQRERGEGSEFEIVAVADGCAARREVAQRLLPAARIYEDHAALLAVESGRIDFVDVTTPPRDHAVVALAALDRGLHVLCEKPLATRPEDARAMLARARARRRVLYPCHNYKHAPVVKAVRRVLDAGAIGRPRYATLDTFRTTHARGVAEWRPDWRRERRIGGGGIAMDHGAHTFYLASSWMGESPRALTAAMSSAGGFDTEDDFVCTLTYPSGVVSARLTWNAGVRKVIYTVHGDRGAIRVEDDEIEITTHEGGAPRTTVERAASAWMDASHAGWFRSLQDDFARAIQAGEHAGREASDALACVELIGAAYASARAGSRAITLAREARVLPFRKAGTTP